jgi:hypothetical protein
MLTLKPFDWRRLTAQSAIAYRLDDDGAIRVRGSNEDTPPFVAARVKSGGGYVSMSLDALGLQWLRAADGDGWLLRSSGVPSTMARVNRQWAQLVRQETGDDFDERLILVTIAVESGGAAPDEEGHVKAPRTEIGYPRRTGERDFGDFERDAEDWRLHGGRHSSHGLMQTLIATAHAARPDLFRDLDPSLYRTALWLPDVSIACGIAYASNFGAAIADDPVRFRVKYGSGGIRPSSSTVWGVDLYDDSVMARFVSRWNDDACLRAGACAAPSFALPVVAATKSAAWIFAAFSAFAVVVTAALITAEKTQHGGARS